MNVPRNAPCPCGSGKKYKKCCLAQDQKTAHEGRAQRRMAEAGRQLAEAAEHDAFIKYATELDELSNRACDLIGSEEWTQAEACCRELLDRFPDEIDGHHRFYECCKARGDFVKAKTHAQATLGMVESREGFDPSFPTELKQDLAAFEETILND